MLKIVNAILPFFMGMFIVGCASVDVPDYNSFEQNIKQVDLKKGELGGGEYSFVTDDITNIKLPGTGYNENYIDTMNGNLSIDDSDDVVKFKILTTMPFFSNDLLRIELDTDKCGKAKNYSLDVYNKDGMINRKSTEVLRKNKKIKETFDNFLKMRSEFACTSWKVGETIDKSNSAAFINTVGGDKLTFKILKLPIKYKGIVRYKENDFYYFKIIDGVARIDSKIFNDDIAKLKISGNMLVNTKNFIIEYTSLILKGNLWSEGFNFDVTLKSNHSFKKIK